MRRVLTLATSAMVLGGLFQAADLAGQDGRFPHESHSAFFSDCGACHSGIASGIAAEVYPGTSTCAPCHDGSTAPDLKWTPPEKRASSLKFTHSPHGFGCETCHMPQGSDHLEALSIPGPETCMGCHNPGVEHQQAEQCGFCHAQVVDFRLTASGAPRSFHGDSFTLSHAAAASAGQPDCTNCHAENTCTQCHDGLGSPSFHPVNFLASHGPEAFGRVSDCTACHSTEVFCRECHLNVGFDQGGGLSASFHTDQGIGFFGHSLGARQDLESCVSCHQQTDCMRCHSARTGLNVNPHGPGFDASSLISLNKATCDLCHTGGR
jgi:predicted CXXCH cytochrome family protein